MPRFDGTGPWGQGAMTGKGLGRCTGAVRPGSGAYPVYGRGFGRGMGYGRGFVASPLFRGEKPVYDYADTVDSPTERESLEAKQNALKEQMDLINKRLDELSAKED